ncbi:MAG: hypothetical protein R3C42_07655 [Parvularculaceae bacterium]|nr:hypothetical protein [Parvularculaceae bacterium]
MTFLDRAASQMGGAWAMAFDLDGWRDRLDRSVDGVFRSFYAFFIAAPMMALYTLTVRRATERMPDHFESIHLAAPPAMIVISDLVFFAADWAVGLALLVLLSRTLGAGKNAAGLIAGFNWSQPITTAIQLPPVALAAATASPAAATLLGLPALALAVTVLWGIIRRGLAISIGPSVAVIAMLVVTSVILRTFADAALRAIIGAQS